jgi:hypothetical protein
VHKAAGRDVGVEAVRAGVPDVVLGEVAGVGDQCGAFGQLGANVVEVLLELVKDRLELLGIGSLIR